MKPKNMRELCSEIAMREGGKSEVSIGNIREIFRVYADLLAEDSKEWNDVFLDYAAQRANRKRKK